MHYVIYPDMLFLENILCNGLFLIFLKGLFFPEATWKKIFFASVLTAICNTLASILFFRCSWILQIGALLPAAGIMVCCCLQIREYRRILYLLYQIVLWTLVLGGILQVLEEWTKPGITEVLISLGILSIVFGTLERILRIYKQQDECMREIVLYWNGKSFHLRGYADTGNQLFTPGSKRPVSIITKEVWDTVIAGQEEPIYQWIPYNSVGNPHGILQGTQIDYMVILRGNQSQIVEKPMIAITEQAFTGIFHYSILLHSDYC